jgi:hypothetical protein
MQIAAVVNNRNRLAIFNTPAGSGTWSAFGDAIVSTFTYSTPSFPQIREIEQDLRAATDGHEARAAPVNPQKSSRT